MEEKEFSIDIMGILYLLKRNIALIIITAIIFGVLGFLGTKLLITPQYASSATMIVSNKVNTAENNTINSSDMQAAQGLVKTYGIIVKSDKVLEQVIYSLGIDETVESINKRIKVEALDQTQVMKITFLDSDPQKAEMVMSKITEIAPPIIVESVGAGNCSVLSNAKVTKDPVSPNVKKNSILALLGGIIVSSLFVIAREFINNTVKSEEDISEKLGLPVLGVIPKIGGK